jgi:hypothetical protein
MIALSKEDERMRKWKKSNRVEERRDDLKKGNW